MTWMVPGHFYVTLKPVDLSHITLLRCRLEGLLDTRNQFHFSMIIGGLAFYILFTGNDWLIPWLFLAMSFIFLSTAIEKFMENRKILSVYLLVVFVSIPYLALDAFFLN